MRSAGAEWLAVALKHLQWVWSEGATVSWRWTRSTFEKKGGIDDIAEVVCDIEAQGV